MTQDVMEFGGRALTPDDVTGKDVLEVGSLYVNGSLENVVRGLAPKTYLQTDMRPGRSVEQVVDACDIVKTLGEKRWDVVLSTETLEHCKDWVGAIENMKVATKPGGCIILTAAGPASGKHEHPHDYWRFTRDTFRKVFADWQIEMLETNKMPTAGPRPVLGIYIKARRPLKREGIIVVQENWAARIDAG